MASAELVITRRIRATAMACAGLLLVASALLSPASRAETSGDTEPGDQPAPLTLQVPGEVPVGQLWDELYARADATVYDRINALSLALDVYTDDPNVPTTEQCSDQAAALKQTLAEAPVSLSLWYMAYRCAAVSDDELVLDQATQALAALIGHALGQRSYHGDARYPIRILQEADVLAWIAASGQQLLAVHYRLDAVRRHLPLQVELWDEEAKIETVLVFDYLDSIMRMSLPDPRAQYPVLRQFWISKILDPAGEAAASSFWIHEAAAVFAILRAPGDPDLDALVALAQAGNLAAVRTYALLCREPQAPAECGQVAVDLMMPMAEQGLATHLQFLAEANASGLGVPANPAMAKALLQRADLRWGKARASIDVALGVFDQKSAEVPAHVLQAIKAAARQGDAYARGALALNEIHRRPDKSPSRKVRSALKEAAEAGYPRYQYLYAVALDQDDPQAAVHWLRRAAEGGLVWAQFRMAQISEDNRWGSYDPNAAMHWHMQAAQSRHKESVLWVGQQLVEQGEARLAMGWLESAHRYGVQEGTLDLAILLINGVDGIADGPPRGRKLLTYLADEHQHLEANRELGVLLLTDLEGVEVDPEEAGRRWRANVAKGDAIAKSHLGASLLHGEIAALPDEDGEALLRNAFEEGFVDAGYRLARAHLHRKTANPDLAQAITLLEQANDAGAIRALHLLATVLCSHVDESIYDPPRGHALAMELERTAEKSPSTMETVAVCNAATGAFTDAIEGQRSAVELERQLDPESQRLTGMQEWLEQFEAGIAPRENPAERD